MREGRCSRLGLVLESWSGADQFSESEEDSPGKGVFLRSVSELRQDSEQQEDPKQSFREEESSFLRQSEGVPDFHVRIAMEKNRKKSRLIHHWFGRDLTVYQNPLNDRVLPNAIPLQRIGVGGSRVTYSWVGAEYVIKLTTLAIDNGQEEHLSHQLREVCALVVHAGPLVVRLDDPHSTSSSRHVVHCLVQQRVRPAEPWVRELEPTECEQWHYYVAAAVPWLGSRGLQMCDITVSNLGLEGEDGTLMLFDLAGWSITGAPAWGGGSGFLSYLQSRCPTVLSVIQSHRRSGLGEMFADLAKRAGPFGKLLASNMATLQDGRLLLARLRPLQSSRPEVEV